MNGAGSPRQVALTGSLLLVGVLLAANAVVFLVVRHHLHAGIGDLPDVSGQLIEAVALDHDSTTLADGGVAQVISPRGGVDRALGSLAVGQVVAVLIVVLLTIVTLRRIVIDARASAERSHRLLTDAAHQLRTPVAAALAANQALLWDVGTDSRTNREGLLVHVQHELARSARVVDRLLRLAVLDHEETPDKRPVNLVTLVASEVERHQDLAPHLSLNAETGDTPVFVNGVEALLREALSNLLDNARRHARSTITVSLKCHAHQVTIAVADDGPGPTRPSDELFARFATFGAHGGSGLGLAVTRAIARSHGGDAQFHDGSFVLRLPPGSPRLIELGPAGPAAAVHAAPTPTAS